MREFHLITNRGEAWIWADTSDDAVRLWQRTIAVYGETITSITEAQEKVVSEGATAGLVMEQAKTVREAV